MTHRTRQPLNQPATVKNSLLLGMLIVIVTPVCAQFNVSEIITDYNGYWKSSASAISNVKPDNSHNLVSFSFAGKRYSTGVNDALLVSKGDAFIPGDYRALAVTNPGSADGSTKIGLGYMYDGVAGGAGTTHPSNNIPAYLTDGIKGLDLGTCVANLPAGTLNFPVQTILAPSIGDGVPDILITQTADPSGSPDRYEFTDINGTRVGNYVDIVLSNIPAAGNWTADFYDANKNPMTLSGGYTKTDRPIRLWTSDLSAFGITAANASKIKYFKIGLSGTSDVAFVAYNALSINLVTALLPVKLTDFTAREINKQVELNWETTAEINSDAFVIEKSTDGSSFAVIATMQSSGNAVSNAKYVYADKNALLAKNYYRLKMLDRDGNFTYSKIIVVTISSNPVRTISMYPNPATHYIIINHPYAASNEQIHLISLHGITILTKKISNGSLQTRIDLPQLSAGVYELLWTNGKTNAMNRIIIQ